MTRTALKSSGVADLARAARDAARTLARTDAATRCRALADIAANGVTESEFDDMKQRFLATRVYDEDNTATRSESIGSSMIAGWRLEDVLESRQRIESISFADVNRVGRELLRNSRSVTGLLVPELSSAKLVR